MDVLDNLAVHYALIHGGQNIVGHIWGRDPEIIRDKVLSFALLHCFCF